MWLTFLLSHWCNHRLLDACTYIRTQLKFALFMQINWTAQINWNKFHFYAHLPNLHSKSALWRRHFIINSENIVARFMELMNITYVMRWPSDFTLTYQLWKKFQWKRPGNYVSGYVDWNVEAPLCKFIFRRLFEKLGSSKWKNCCRNQATTTMK